MGFPVPDYDTLAGEISAPAYSPDRPKAHCHARRSDACCGATPPFHGRRPLSLEDLALQAQNAVETLLARASASLRERLSEGGRLSAAKIEREQHAAHGLAWLATYVEAIKELGGYARRLSDEGRFGETEELLTRIGLGEYLAQIFGGVAMNQGEIVRLGDFGLKDAQIAPLRAGAVETLIETGNTVEARARLAALIA